MNPVPPESPGVPARRAALKLLDAVLRRGQAIEAALGPATAGIDRADDRALAHAIAAQAIRRLGDLDALIDSTTKTVLPPDAKARMALRIALVQALALGTPPHAAIATVLPLVDGGPRKLVHGVFGTLMRRGVSLPEAAALPEAVEQRWLAAWGEEVVIAAGKAVAEPPPLDLTLADPATTAEWAERLGGISLAPGHVRLPLDAVRVPSLPGYDEGAWWVQDLAATLPARLIGSGHGRALDLCAAPGGKTLQLAAAGWQVTALDKSARRLDRVRDNLARTRLAARMVIADALGWGGGEYDAVLLDAPCSATGIFRRHPEVLHRVHRRVIEEAVGLQTGLLHHAAAHVVPGGVLVYAVCSLEPEEGEAQIEAFLSAHPDFGIEPAREDELPAGIAPGDYVRTLPGTLAEAGGCDGFFVARMRRCR